MDHFELHSEYKPTGDQPQAIERLVRGFKEGNQFETLLGVTGSGKTFTMANVIAQLNKPTLILAHNKTLAAQLYGEMKEFFPENAVEYFVSYYDYYQPEAFVPSSDTYIASMEVHLISGVLNVDQFPDYLIPVFGHSRTQGNHHVKEFLRGTQSVDTGNGGNDHYVFPL